MTVHCDKDGGFSEIYYGKILSRKFHYHISNFNMKLGKSQRKHEQRYRAKGLTTPRFSK